MQTIQARLGAYIHSLVRHERALVVVGAIARLGGVAAVAWALGLAAYALQGDRSAWGAGIVLWVGVAGFFLSIAPGLRAWVRAGDLVGQARMVESRVGGLDGKLLTSVERLRAPREGESAEIVAWIAEQAAAAVRDVPPSAVHGARGAVAAWSTYAALLGFAAVLSTQVPGGAGAAWGWWVADGLAGASMVAIEGGEGLPPARVGDLTLRYVYPDYTGLEPYEVVNSTGEARAVPGTRVEVSARSADPIEAAAIIAYEDASTDAGVVDERQIRGSFTMGVQPGHWRIVTYRRGAARTSREFAIVPEPDLPPEVTTQADAPVLEVPLDGWIELPWSASDDFGLSRVALEVDGKAAGADLKRPTAGTKAIDDLVRRRPLDLGMIEGSTYEVQIAAWDNDTVSGAKVGRSRAIKVIVLGADGLASVSREQRAEMMALLLDALADHLEEIWPPGSTSGEMSRWGQTVSDRYRPLATALEGFRSRRGRVVRDFRFAEIAVDAGRELIRYSQVAFVPLDRQAAQPAAMEEVVRLRQEAVATLEDAILSLDRLQRAEAMAEVTEAAQTLADLADEVERELARQDLTAAELVYRAADLSAYVERVKKAAEDTDDGAIRAFVEARAAELAALLAEVGAAAREGDMADARTLMGRASASMRQMAEGLRDELQRRIEQAKEQEGEAKDLAAAIKELIVAQDDLGLQVGTIREETEGARAAQLSELWDRVRASVGKLQRRVTAFEDALGEDRPFNEREMVGDAQEEVRRLGLGADLQDLPGVMNGSDQLLDLWLRYQARHQLLSARGLIASGKGPAEAEVREVLSEIGRTAELIELIRRADEAGDPGARGRLQAIAPAQAALSERLASVRADAKKVAQEFPVRPRGLEIALESASARMAQATGDLEGGRGLAAQGSQQAASRHLREALEALQDAMQEASRSAAKMAQSGQGGGEEEGEGAGEGGDEEGDGAEGGKDKKKGGEDGEEESESSAPIELPEPEEFRTPEAYRRSLLEGMEGDVPEEFKALKRRYYEELVHQ
jgi:hypothetical protein